MIPSPWVGIVLLLLAYRLTRLIGWDDVPPVQKLRDRITGAKWIAATTPELAAGVTGYWRYSRPVLASFIACAFCQGFWVSCLVYGVWIAAGSPGHLEPSSWFFYAAIPFGLSGAVGLVARNLDP